MEISQHTAERSCLVFVSQMRK